MVGELVMDRFRIMERIGSGGMGTVYRAFDERLQRHVAVKEIAAPDADRVLREAHAVARLNHPGIVTLYELGAAGHRALLVSELVEGSTLAELARSGELSDRDVAELGADVCDALDHAHERGVVHRDIKPQNVIVRADDGAGRRAKLMDFGIAAVSGAPTLTAAGQVVGTLAYMAPEQADGDRATAATDVYSVALTLYECWTGKNPVARGTPAATARAIGEPLPPIRELRPDLPERLAERLDACLDPDPGHRPPLAALHTALEGAAPALDDVRPVPAASEGSGWTGALPARQFGAAAGVVLAGAALAYVGGHGGEPGPAMLLAIASGVVAALVGLTGAAAGPVVACALAGLALWGSDGAAGPVLLAASAMGFAHIVRLRHMALALLTALLWVAGLEGLGRLFAGGGIAGPPQAVAALVVLALVIEFAGRSSRAERAPIRSEPHARAPRTA